MAPLVGRDPELAELEQALRSVPRPLDVVLRGEAGIGKTTLWQTARCTLTARGHTVLMSRPSEAEAELPYAALMDLLDPIVTDEHLGKLPAPQRVALEVALLRRVAEEEGVSELAVAAGVLRVMSELARQAPLVLALDDAQWVDPASATTLAFVLRRLHERDVTVLSTVRSPLRSAVGHDHGGSTVEIVLRGLDIEALDELIQTRLQRRLLLPGLIQLARLSGGNPMAALELVRASEGRDVDLDLGTAVAVPPELGALLRRRLGPLSDEARRFLVLAAAAAAPDLEVLGSVTDEPDIDRLLREAEQALVLDLTGGTPRFAHPLLTEVILGAATPAERRAAHASLAQAVADEVDRARHVAASTVGPDEGAAGIVEEGARQAWLRAAPAAAAPLFEHATRLTPHELTSAVARRTVDAVDSWVAAGAPQRGVDVARLALEALPRSPLRGRVLAALSGALRLTGGDVAAHPLLEQAAAEVAGDDAATALVFRQLGWERAVIGDLRRGMPAVQTAVAAAERIDDPSELAATLAAMAMLQFLGGVPEAPSTLHRALAVLPAGSSSNGRHDLERDRAIMAAWSDDPDALTLIASQRREAVARGNVDEEQYWEWYELLVRLRTGPWTGVLQRASTLGQEARRLGIGGQTSSQLWLRSLVEAHHGHVADARRHAEAGIEAAPAEHMNVFELWCEGVLGFLEVVAGEHERAADRLWNLHRRCEDAGFGEPGHLRHLADAVEAHVAAGRVPRADELARRLEEMGRRTGHPWARAAGLRCRGLVREAAGDRDGAIADLEDAVVAHEQLAQPLELGRTLLALGSALRRARRKAAARQVLDRATLIFEDLPAPLWRDRTAGELARVRGPAHSRWELTPTERRIAGLVASGRSNREVAAELYLSTKTVEWNLSKVYRKVGVRSRSELARAWAPSVDDVTF